MVSPVAPSTMRSNPNMDKPNVSLILPAASLAVSSDNEGAAIPRSNLVDDATELWLASLTHGSSPWVLSAAGPWVIFSDTLSSGSSAICSPSGALEYEVSSSFVGFPFSVIGVVCGCGVDFRLAAATALIAST